MRAITGQENAVLNAPDGHSVHVRVWVWDGSAYQNVAALEGRNWLVSVEWDESVNEPCAQATVSLRRRLEDYSLNPLVSNKLTGLLALARPFIIETATVPLGDPAQESDFREVFRGIVETLALDKDPITFTGRDMAGPLLRAYIENEAEYGSDAGTPVESIIQSILTANGTGVTLYVRNASGGTTTGAVFGRFKQKKAAVLTACREIALKIGWDLRYLWSDTAGEFRFTLVEPDRTATLSSWTFQPNKVKAVTKLTQTLFDVRNAIRLYYYNRTALDAAGKAPLALVVAEDPTSQATYGRQYMQLAESEDSPVDSPAEAQVMCNAALLDLKNPLLEFGVDVGYHYAVQLGDMLTFAADDLHFSNPQTLAVVSIAHRVDGRGHRTSIQLRGKPVGANDAWLAREGRVRMSTQPPVSAPDAVSSLTATATAGGAVINFIAPVTPPVPVEFELHVGTSSGFTPSLSTLREKGARTNFEVTGLTPGTTYYAKVVGRDRVGNRSTAVQVSFTTRYVEPRTLQPRTASSAPNPYFEASNNLSGPPDTWTLISPGVWGTDASGTTDSFSGSVAVVFVSGALAFAPTIRSQLFPVRGGDQWSFGVAWKQSSFGDAGTFRVVFLASTDPDGTPVGSTLNETMSDATGTTLGVSGGAAWLGLSIGATVPGAARYAMVEVQRTAAFTGVLTLDSVDALRSTTVWTQWRILGDGVDGTTHPFENDWSQWAPLDYYPVMFRRNLAGRCQIRGVGRSPTPAPAGYDAVFTLPEEYWPTRKVLRRLNSGTGITDVEVHPDGTVRVASITANTYLPLDGLEWDVP